MASSISKPIECDLRIAAEEILFGSDEEKKFISKTKPLKGDLRIVGQTTKTHLKIYFGQTSQQTEESKCEDKQLALDSILKRDHSTGKGTVMLIPLKHCDIHLSPSLQFRVPHSYDEDVDALTLHLISRDKLPEKYNNSQTFDDIFIFDLNDKNRISAVEILCASEYIDLRMDDEKKNMQFLADLEKHDKLSHFTPLICRFFLELIELDFLEPECLIFEDEIEMNWISQGICELVELDTLRFVIKSEIVVLPTDIRVFHVELPEELEKMSHIFLDESIRFLSTYWNLERKK